MTWPRTIAITGLGARQPGMPVVRALRKAGYPGRFIGLCYDPLEPGNYEPDMARSYLMPYPREGAGHYMAQLEEIHRTETIDVLVSTLDSELGMLSRSEPRLRELGIRSILPTPEQLASRSKVRLPELARRARLRVPETRIVYSFENAFECAVELGYPVVVKGQLYEAVVVRDPQQLDQAMARIASGWGLPVIVQRLIPGIEYDVVALGGRDGELLGAVSMKKLQLDAEGKAWGSISVADPELDELVRRAIKTLRWRGIFELELMRAYDDGKYYLIEINPRAPAWIYLSVAAGQNLPAALVHLAMGDQVEPLPPYTVGTLSLRQCIDLVCPASDYAALVTVGGVDKAAPGELPLPKWRSEP